MKSNLALAVAMAITVGVTAACAGDRADRERAWETVFRAALAQGRAPIVRCTVPPTVCADTLLWQAIGSPEVLLVVGPLSSRVICLSAAGYRRCMNVVGGEEWLEIWSGAAWTVVGAN
jgi:hypothetical protein